MGLAIKRFFQTIPQLPYRFVTDFVKAGEVQSSLRFAVRSVKYSEAEGNIEDGAVYYGNGYYTIPLWDISSRSLSITFEETDNMKVTKFLDSIAEKSYNASPLMIAVIVREYDNMLLNPMKGRCYWCFLQDYDEPSFARTGGPSVVSITANFVVRAISENYAVDDDELNARIEKIAVALDTQNYHDTEATGFWYDEFKQKAKDTVTNTTVKIDNFAQFADLNTKAGAGTKDFNVTDEEVAALQRKILVGSTKTKGTNVETDTLKRVLVTNAKAMEKSMNTLKSELAAKGIKVSVNAYMDTNHAIGLGTKSGSHILGQKIDLTFLDSSGKKITVAMMSKEQYETIKAAAETAGLVTNWEAHGDGTSSSWGDFALAEAMSIDKDGKLIEKQSMTSWTKDDTYYNPDLNKKIAMGWKQRQNKGT